MTDIRKTCVEAIFREFEDHGDAISPACGDLWVTSSDTSTSTWPTSWTSLSTPSTRS